MKTWTKYLALLAVTAMIGVTRADDAQTPAPANPDKAAQKAERQAERKAKRAANKPANKQAAVRGKLVSVDGNALKLTRGKKDQQKEITVTADANTVVMIKGVKSTLADLKPGQQIVITPVSAENATAAKIVVGGANKGKRKAPAAENAADQK